MLIKNRVKKHSEFQYIIESGTFKRSNFFNFYYIKNELNYTRIGISVPKKSGNAVVRNKIKRQIRAICSNLVDFSKPYDFVFIVRKAYDISKFDEIKEDIQTLLKIG